MEKVKKILCGVSDYAEIRKSNGYFVDRTDKFRLLEDNRFVLFLRPRRFGKSLFTAMLQLYYDVAEKGNFDSLYGGTKIYENPTGEHNKYLILHFDFSGVAKNPATVRKSFHDECNASIDAFMAKYRSLIPKQIAKAVAEAQEPGLKLSVLAKRLDDKTTPLYVIIDEYDNFTNTILAEHGLGEYNDLCHGDGEFKQFFTELKLVTTGANAPLKRLFITGVSPVTMDDVTSGFNIGTNLTLDPAFADMMGFTMDDVREMLEYYRDAGVFHLDVAETLELIQKNYNGYSFCQYSLSEDIPPKQLPPIKLCNPYLVLYFMQEVLRNRQRPEELFNSNVRTDYAKIQHLVTLDNRLNGNFSILESFVTDGSGYGKIVDSFQAREMGLEDNFRSLLFYFGLVSYRGIAKGTPVLAPPNETVRFMMSQMLSDGYARACKVNNRLNALMRGLADWAYDGEWRGAVETMAKSIRESFAVRDGVEGEKVVQGHLCALLTIASNVFLVKPEFEANGGYADLALAPNFLYHPDMKFASLVELKYIKASEKATPAKLRKLKADAKKQLAKYAADHNLSSAWHLKKNGKGKAKKDARGVSLIKLSIVFHGGELVQAEEV